MTDSEGSASFFRAVNRSNIIRLSPHEGLKFHRANENDYFIYGGDVTDRGPYDLAITRLLVDFKKRHPNNVFLLAGNREITKTRFLAELDPLLIRQRLLHGESPRWLPQRGTVPLDYVKKAMLQHNSRADIKNIATLHDYVHSLSYTQCQIIYLQWMLNETMGCPHTFRFRRVELSREQDGATISDEQVLQSFIDQCSPTGITGQYLQQAQLGIVIPHTGVLAVHGGLTTSNIGRTPAMLPTAEPIRDVKEWIDRLNDWFDSQIRHWIAFKPTQLTRPACTILDDFSLPLPNQPKSIMIADMLGKDRQFAPVHAEVSSYLSANNIQVVLTGHQPCSDHPAILRTDKLLFINGDTGYAKMDPAHPDDTRGDACHALDMTVTPEMTQVEIKATLNDNTSVNTALMVTGSGIAGDAYIGSITPDERLVQCRLDNGNYRLVHQKAHHVTYTTIEPHELEMLMMSGWGKGYDNIPDINLNGFLANEFSDLCSTGHPSVLPPDVHFTILNPAYMTRSIAQVQNLYKAIGTANWEDARYRTIGRLVVPTPARCAFQLTGILTAMMVKVKNGRHFVETCTVLEKIIQIIIAARATEFTQLMLEAANVAKQARFGQLDANHPLQIKYNTLKETINQRIGQYDDLNADNLAEQLVADDVLRENMYNCIHAIITDVIETQIAANVIERLPIYPQEQWGMQVVTGGPCTGKSFLMKNATSWFQRMHHVPIEFFCNISTDRQRLCMLSDPAIGEDHRLHGTLTHTEARVMIEYALQTISRNLKTKGEAAKVYIEQMYASHCEVDYVKQHGGRLHVAITSYPAEKAVEGNLKRYQETKKRLVPVPVLLGGIQSSVRSLPKIFKENPNEKILISIYDTYGMIHAGRTFDNALIAEFNCETNSITIYDIMGFFNFLKNAWVNVNATGPGMLFTEPAKITLAALVTDCITQYRDYRWQFKETGHIQCYAEYTPENGLIVHKYSAFNLQCQQEAGKLLLTKLTESREASHDNNAPSRVLTI